jgi:hypothetical protein
MPHATAAPTPSAANPLDAHLPAALRAQLEQRYWAPIGDAAALERFITDPALYVAPDRHPALFADHGVVHVRDIAASAAALAGRLHGTLLPPRPPAAQRFVQGLAVLLAYVHDIGMVEPTAAGRKVHPQFAAQTVLGAGFDDLADALWQADAGGLRTRLLALHSTTPPAVPLPQCAREVLAMALCHSKSAVPAAWLDDRPRLRQLMLRACFTDLAAQHHGRLAEQAAAGRDRSAPAAPLVRYADADAQAFAWLVAPQPAAQAFVDEVIDAVRLLRAADALRQRGTTLRTSAGYEVCTDSTTGEAVVGPRSADQRLALLLRFDNPISAAEANLRATAMTADGHLCVEFYRGAFAQAGVRERLLVVTADVIADIEADALASFSHPAATTMAQRRIRLTAPADDHRFADELAALIAARHPRLAGRLQVVAPDADPDSESTPISPAPAAAWEATTATPAPLPAQLFAQMAAHGLHVAAIDRTAALAGTRCATVPAGTVLLQPGSLGTFVVVPLGPGLALQPTGGYPPQPLHPWIPLGVTGVVRGGERNAAVVAESAVDVLLIDGHHYLAAWFRPYDLSGLRARLAAAPAPT